MTAPRWSLVVPVKGSNEAKSRLRDDRRAALATAMALDTVCAALAAPSVGRVIVVVPRHAAAAFAALGARTVTDPGGGLLAAVRAGLRATDAGTHRAVLLGDLPALRTADLESGLRLALRAPRSVIPDWSGLGTTFLAARAGEPHRPAFGPGSALAHVRRGYRAVTLPRSSTLRTDVDTVEDLERVRALGAGPRTRAVLAC